MDDPPPNTTAPEPVRTAVPDLLGGGSVVLGVLVGATVTLAVTIGPAALMRESYSDSVMFSLLAVVLAAGVVLTLVQRTRRTGLGLLLGILVAALVALAFFVALLATF